MSKSKIVYKPWGREEWLELNDKYCYKRLYINAGTKTSYQYHEKKLETNTGLIFLIWLIAMCTPAILLDHQSPWFLLYVFGSVVVLAIIATWWYSYVNKGEK